MRLVGQTLASGAPAHTPFFGWSRVEAGSGLPWPGAPRAVAKWFTFWGDWFPSGSGVPSGPVHHRQGRGLGAWILALTLVTVSFPSSEMDT